MATSRKNKKDRGSGKCPQLVREKGAEVRQRQGSGTIIIIWNFKQTINWTLVEGGKWLEIIYCNC